MPSIPLPSSTEEQSPDVSVVIPTYNRLPMLEEALASVASQEFDGTIEIIVVDDNSQDKTSETIARKYPAIHLISLKQNVGPSAARNQGILAAQGRYIAFLDSDDLWERTHLTSQIAVLEKEQNCFCISGRLSWDTVKDLKWVSLQKPNLEKYTSPVHHLLAGGSFVATPSSVVFPRQVFSEVGLFDEELRFAEDTVLYIRCLLAGYRPIFTELPTVIRRKHNEAQATDATNTSLRKKIRLEVLNQYYPLAQKRFDMVSIERIKAEIHTSFANQYFKEKYFRQWITSIIISARYYSIKYALSSMLADINQLLQRRLAYTSRILKFTK